MASLRSLALPALALAAVACTAGLTGCNENQKTAQSDILKSNDDLTKEVNTKNEQLGSIGEQLARAQQENVKLQAQLDECTKNGGAVAIRESDEGGVAHKASSVDTKALSGIPGVDVTVVDGDIHLTIASSQLFDSGRVSIKDGARHTLDKVATKLKELYPTREIIVVGHTDADPIRKSSFATNYHLGFERAYAVREYLVKKGVNEGHVALMSYGPDQPGATKEKSRRVDIVVTDRQASSGSGVEKPTNAPTAADKSKATKKTAPAKSTTSTKSATPAKKPATTASK
ncbi:MAG: OmpA family protein [Phycisphaerales bacterium]